MANIHSVKRWLVFPNFLSLLEFASFANAAKTCLGLMKSAVAKLEDIWTSCVENCALTLFVSHFFQAGYCLSLSQCMSCRSCRLQWDRLGCKIFDLPQARTRYISDINLRVSQCPGNRCIDQEVLLIQTALQNDAVI